jgi:outer membrane protein assembly factor BamB
VQEDQITQRFPSFDDTVVGQPIVADVDGDGRTDFVATFAVDGETLFVKNRFVHAGPAMWVEAISGRTHRPLWRYNVQSLAHLWQNRFADMPYASAVVPMGGRQVVVLVLGARLVGLDLQSGKEAWPAHDLGSTPASTPRFADLTAVGHPDALLLEKQAGGAVELEVVSVPSRRKLWSTALATVKYPNQRPWQEALVDVLQSGGKPEVLTLFREQDAATVEVRDPATGAARWLRRLVFGHWPWGELPIRLVCGPDLDGDGYRDVFVATLVSPNLSEPGRTGLFVDALSGKDGHMLWTARVDLPQPEWNIGGSLGPLRWWQAGPDGWPLLVVPCGPSDIDGVGKWHTHVFGAAGGRLEYTLPEFGYPHVADLNGDGIPDLYAQLVRGHPNQAGGKLRALRGLPPEPWRLMSQRCQAAQDFDADGLPDLIAGSGPRQILALSGRDAHVLWRSEAGWQASNASAVPEGDLDGDGTADVLLEGTGERSASPVLRALSGRTGRELWSAKLPRQPVGSSGFVNISELYLECHPLALRDRPGQSDVLFGYLVDRPVVSKQGYLARLAGSDGRVLWNKPLQMQLSFHAAPSRLRPGRADLDGDEILDLVLWVAFPTQDVNAHRLDLCAFSGRDGSLLWKGPGFAPGVTGPRLPFVTPPRPLVRSVGRDSAAEIIVTTFLESRAFEVVALDGKDGRPKWTWRGDDATDANGNAWEEATPQWVNLAAGPALCVSIHDQKVQRQGGLVKSGFQLVLLDATRGHVLQRRDLKSEAWRVAFWSLDLDGDGKDEVVFLDGGKVHATHGGVERELWTWPLPGGQGSILDMRPAMVVVAAGDSVYGLDGATGVPRWRCEARKPTMLHPADPQALPRLVSSGPPWICRTALPTAPTGRYTMPAPGPVTYGPVPDTPRLVRLLPWWRALRLMVFEWGPFRPSLFLSFGFAAAVFVAGLFLRRALRRRSWKLGLLSLVLLATPVAWAWFHFGAELTAWAVPYLIWMVVVALPLLLFAILPVRSVIRRRWRGVLLWSVLLLLSTVAVAYVCYVMDVRLEGLSEYYVWDYWYAFFLPGGWAAAVLFLAALLLRALYLWAETAPRK